MTLGTLHRRFGAATIILFLMTGVFLRIGFPDLYGQDDTVRFLYRANHVYILLAGLVNLALGLHLERGPAGWRVRLQLAGSGAMLLATLLLITAFFRDPPGGTAERPWTSAGVLVLFGGLMCHVAGRRRRRAA